MPNAQNGIQHSGDHICRRTGIQHILDMSHQRHAGKGRAHQGRVADRGHLVSEIGAGDHCSGYQCRVETKAHAHAHHGNTRCTHGAPGGAQDQRHRRTQQHGHQQENAGADYLQAKHQHRGDRAGCQPGSDHDAYCQNNGRGGQGVLSHFIGLFQHFAEAVA